MRKFHWVILLAVCLGLAVAVSVAQAQSVPPEDGASIDGVTVAGNLPWQYGVLDSEADEYNGKYVDIAISPHNGVVYVSYYDASDGGLRVAHSVTPGTGDCGPSNAWKCETVDSGGWIPNDDTGQHTSIDVRWVDRTYGIDYNQVGVSYYNATDGTLKYAEYYCSVSLPITCSWSTQVVDSPLETGDTAGLYSSLKLDSDGDIVIAYQYYDDPDGSMNFTRYYSLRRAYYVGSSAGNCGDDTNWQCDTIHTRSYNPITFPATGGPTAEYISLDVNYEDTVFIAFYQDGDLYYTWYQGFGGSCTNTGWNCVLIDSSGDVGMFASLHAPDSNADKMQIAYYDSTNGDIKYAIMVGSGGTCTSTAFTCYAVDEVGAGFTQLGLSLSVDSEGAPIIAYQHDNQEQYSVVSLKVARPASRMGQSFGIGNCGDVPPGYLFMYWWCETVDDGYQDIVWEADFAAVAVNPEGRAYVAYYEDDSYYMEGRLKIAWQEFYMSFLPYLSKQP